MLRRRRPIARAAVVGGAAYHAGKKMEQNRQEDALEQEAAMQAEAPAEEQGITDDAMERLKKLSELMKEGVLTQEEFDAEKQRILGQ